VQMGDEELRSQAPKTQGQRTMPAPKTVSQAPSSHRRKQQIWK
jgi:hypothetical protein